MVVKNAKPKENNYDIVYFLKDSTINEELRYSLRTLHNFPHNKVWFYGGCPKGLKPDYHIHCKQTGNKWENVRMMLIEACKNPQLSPNFWIFNDDFFVMEKIDKPVNYYNGDLYKRIVTLEDKFKSITSYSQLIRNVCKELEAFGCETKNYTLHVPILINKKKMLNLLKITNCIGYRSLYANFYKIGGQQMNDVKITNIFKRYKSGPYLSTDDRSFNGMVGKQIKKMFPTKSRFEK